MAQSSTVSASGGARARSDRSPSRPAGWEPDSHPARLDELDFSANPPAIATAGSVTAITAVIAGAWLAAGSTGLLGDALRNGLALLALLTAIVAGWPGLWRAALALLIGSAGLLLDVRGVNVCGLAAAVLLLGSARGPAERRAFSVAGSALVVFALYLTAKKSIPAFWLTLDPAGAALGRLAESLGGTPLLVGSYFAGMDNLVLMLALWAAWLAATPAPRLVRGGTALAAIVVGHLAYLILLAKAGEWVSGLPPVPPPRGPIPALEPPRESLLLSAGRMLIPWNLPVVAALLHLAIAAALLRWTRWPEPPGGGAAGDATSAAGSAPGRRLGRTPVAIGLGLVAVAGAALLPPTTLAGAPLSLAGKKVVCYEKGFLNWLKPKWGEYGRLSIGMYGLLPQFVESLGGSCVISPGLSAEDLEDADVLVLLFPTEPWQKDQLERIRAFVERGGGLLVMGEHSSCEDGPDGIPDINAVRFNEVLQATAGAIHVNFDSSTFAVGGWLQSYEPLAHPMNAGIGDRRNDFGCVIGASLAVRHPARPLLIGRFGWADPGNLGAGPAMMGNDRYDPGEKLGDQILVAEQRVGRGTVVAFGDTSSITNGIMYGSYEYLSRLLGYLGNASHDPQPVGRQALGGGLALAALLALLWRPGGLKAGAAALGLGGALAAASIAQARIPHELPDRARTLKIAIPEPPATPQAFTERQIDRPTRPVDVAYLDLSHVIAVSEESLRPNALMGLHLVLLREEYLTFTLPEITRERLDRAGLVVMCAPTGRYTRQERAILREWVRAGGRLIITVGYERAGPLRELLADFNISVGLNPHDESGGRLEPLPLGHFKSPFLQVAGEFFHVRFHAAWPVWCTDVDLADPAYFGQSDPRIMAYGAGNVPVIVMRQIGSGSVVVIGDTNFATNQNLEHIGGEPFEGMRENAEFWRFLLGELRGQRWQVERLERPAATRPTPAPQAPEPPTPEPPAPESPTTESPAPEPPMPEPPAPESPAPEPPMPEPIAPSTPETEPTVKPPPEASPPVEWPPDPDPAVTEPPADEPPPGTPEPGPPELVSEASTEPRSR